ncbi:MAG: GAF domain-containing protein [Deltaproteobacteria bacterium]|nr:MAG: GAF domain-containing protein [Deltaproteobacteria bacterium]
MMKLRKIEFPFKSRLSLKLLLDFWERLLAEGKGGMNSWEPVIRQKMANAPELREPIDDLAILEKHQELIELLMSAVFPPAFWESDCAAAFVPFQFTSFYATPAFKTMFRMEGQGFTPQLNIDPQQWQWGMTLKAYILILRKFYGIDLAWSYPLIAQAKCPKTGIDRFFNIVLDPKFLEIKVLGEPRTLTEADRNRLLSNVTDLKLWMELIPAANFEFQGFGVFKAADVTAREMLAALQADLFEKEAIFQQDGFAGLQEKLQIYLDERDITLGLAAIRGEQVLILPHAHRKSETSCILENATHYQRSEYRGSIFSQAMERDEPLVVEDLQNYPKNTILEERMLDHGYRSVYVAPLRYQDRLLGTLALKSTRPGALNALNTANLQPVLPLFAVALNRSLEQLNQKIQAVIKEEFTAIHPAVEWRFQQAALNYIQRKDEGVSLEPIVFHQVYPLFGVSDIRESSDHRNAAIQADLIEHFRQAQDILQLAHKHRPLPILAAFSHRLNKHIKGLKRGLNAGDEATKPLFIQREIEPLFDQLADFGRPVAEKIAAYRAALDPEMRTIYRSRRDFEESLKRINETVATYLEEEEAKAQEYFPHYFEKLKTDGVEHTIYIGASMVENGNFNPMYLKNLRLWQLMVTCEVVRRTVEIKDNLKVPLETTHLILAQDSPLSIFFSPDERHFEVEGAYDIRHEIIKKRIDKAVIKGKSERLTQPGKIAIVYSQRQEVAEYLEYIDYLQAAGYLKAGTVDVELEDLQGAQGLKALRVTVDLDASRMQKQLLPEIVTAAVQSLPQRANAPS